MGWDDGATPEALAGAVGVTAVVTTDGTDVKADCTSVAIPVGWAVTALRPVAVAVALEPPFPVPQGQKVS